MSVRSVATAAAEAPGGPAAAQGGAEASAAKAQEQQQAEEAYGADQDDGATARASFQSNACRNGWQHTWAPHIG